MRNRLQQEIIDLEGSSQYSYVADKVRAKNLTGWEKGIMRIRFRFIIKGLFYEIYLYKKDSSVSVYIYDSLRFWDTDIVFSAKYDRYLDFKIIKDVFKKSAHLKGDKIINVILKDVRENYNTRKV